MPSMIASSLLLVLPAAASVRTDGDISHSAVPYVPADKRFVADRASRAMTGQWASLSGPQLMKNSRTDRSLQFHDLQRGPPEMAAAIYRRQGERVFQQEYYLVIRVKVC